MVQLGDYELEDEIGRGGMGRVFRARHRPTGAVRALKVLDGAADAEAVLRFRREAEALARVGPSVAVAVHEAGHERGRTFFAMDLMPGGSLEGRLRAARPSWQEGVRLIARIARAVERCHAVGLVHRDLKPANVLFALRGAEDGDLSEPRLADFGCARDLAVATLTESGTSLGTPGYMAPEQLDGKRGDERSDVYSLAVILHEIVAGAPPHSGHTWRELLLATQRGLPEPVALAAGAPAALDGVLSRGLAPDPAQRTRSAAELARELEDLEKPSAPRSALPIAALGLVAALALGAGAWALASRGDAPRVSPPAPSSLPATPSPRGVAPELARRLRSGNAAPSELESLFDTADGSQLLSELASKAVVFAPDTLRPALDRHPASSELAILEAVATLATSSDASRRAAAKKRLAAPDAIGPGLAQLLSALKAMDEIRADTAAVRAAPAERRLRNPKALARVLEQLEKQGRPELFPAAVAELDSDCHVDVAASSAPVVDHPVRLLFEFVPALATMLERLPRRAAVAWLTLCTGEHGEGWTANDKDRIRMDEVAEAAGRELARTDPLLSGHAFSLAVAHRSHSYNPRVFDADVKGAEEGLDALSLRTDFEAIFAAKRLHAVERNVMSAMVADAARDDRARRRHMARFEAAAVKAQTLKHRQQGILDAGVDSRDFRIDDSPGEDAHRIVAVRIYLGKIAEARQVRGLGGDDDPLVPLLEPSVDRKELLGRVNALIEKTAVPEYLLRSAHVVRARLRGLADDKAGAEEDVALLRQRPSEHDWLELQIAEMRLPAP